MAQVRADRDTARFVVWRNGGELVVYDRELGSIERRDTHAGVLDAPAAAAAALTIKTMMRLPPPPELAPELAPSLAALAPGPDVRLQVGLATRLARGDTTAFSTRIAGGVAVRPWGTAGWRFGVVAEGGTATDVARAGFKGTWRDWAALGVVSWSHVRAAWEIEPHAAAGVRRAALEGSEPNALRTEVTTLPAVRAGLALRWRARRWSLGAQLALDASFGTPTYTKTGASAEIFRMPDVGISLGAVLAVDL
jgi:hypothetical protein